MGGLLGGPGLCCSIAGSGHFASNNAKSMFMKYKYYFNLLVYVRRLSVCLSVRVVVCRDDGRGHGHGHATRGALRPICRRECGNRVRWGPRGMSPSLAISTRAHGHRKRESSALQPRV